ncbi:MAG: hypothetical protein AB6733_21030 [Clostridiaceae bacterium]
MNLESALKKLIFVIVIGLVIYFGHSIYSKINGPNLSNTATEKVNIENEPIQSKIKNINKINKNIDDMKIIISPVVNYSISAEVKSTEDYSSGWNSKISPVDLALAWGKLNDKNVDKYISYSQSNRWCYYTYKEECPVDSSYIDTHSSNNHIIPANDNLWRAAKAVKKGDVVKLDGYLVNVQCDANGQNFTWNSSTTRNDTGDGACEVFYVNEITIGDKVYK